MDPGVVHRVAIGGLCVSAGLGLWLWYSRRRDSQARVPDTAPDPASNPRAKAGMFRSPRPPTPTLFLLPQGLLSQGIHSLTHPTPQWECLKAAAPGNHP